MGRRAAGPVGDTHEETAMKPKTVIPPEAIAKLRSPEERARTRAEVLARFRALTPEQKERHLNRRKDAERP